MLLGMETLKQIVEHQAEMESLWNLDMFNRQVSLLTAALRHLHAVIEGDVITADLAKRCYWERGMDHDIQEGK